jgi:signal transduction histidine kinase
MASAPSAAQADRVPYQRFSELILVSVAGHYVFALFYGVVLGQWGIALALGGPATLVLGLFPLVKASVSPVRTRIISHAVLLLNFLGLNLSVIWMGLHAATSAWWLVWWPMFVAHLIGVRDGLAWITLALLAAVGLWLNEQHQWIAPLMRQEDNPLLLMQMGFLLIGAGFGVVVRRAHDRYEHDIKVQQATINQQKQALEWRASKLEGMLQVVQQSNLDRTRMFAQISHEVRTPLNGLLGFAQLLKMTPLSEQQSLHVEQINRCGDTLLQIVNDVLDFSRLENLSTQLDIQPFDAVRVANEAVDMLAPIALQKGVLLSRNFAVDTLQAVGDPLRVKQVMINLLANALKFTLQGEVQLRCAAHQREDGQACLHVEVQDSGIGIPPDAMAHLFQPFSKASDHTIRQFGGSGLGLAICKRLVDRMNGTIGVSSEPGQGSLFWFEVPLLAR